MTAPLKASDRIFVALDHENILDADQLALKLGDRISHYKIGMGSLTIGGGALALELIERGKKVFMDLKFFDIPSTVERAVRGHVQMGLDFMTVHGDPSVVAGAVEGRGGSKMNVLAVTILTSSDRADLDRGLIKPGNIADLVVERAGLAFQAGADGVIASAEEAALIRVLPEAKGKLIVTPGIRPTGSSVGDQKRVVTPLQAVKNGSDYLVIGRPITGAADPRAVVDQIVAELDAKPV